MALGKADASATKQFFVGMITKDITLEDCILDLIDNSVDAAWSQLGGFPKDLSETHSLDKFEIEIECSEDRFLIRDNCGGFSFEEARDYVFSFGRDQDRESEDFSIGVYGIGMKRAIFKMARNAIVKSKFAGKTEHGEFKVPVRVDAWLKKKKLWEFPIEANSSLKEAGVEIALSKLTSGTQAAFRSPEFVSDLKRIIMRDYSLHLHHGIVIKVNGDQLRGWPFELRSGPELQPVRFAWEPKVGVQAEIIAGMAAPPPDDNNIDEMPTGDEAFGWYVICNGRVVLAGDKTSVAGWGTTGWPSWHGQYNGFVGVLLLTAKDAGELPLTTTKRSVDTTDEIYRAAQVKMKAVSKDWTKYTNSRKQTLDDSKKAEGESKPVKLYEIAEQEKLVLPQYTPKPKARVANINYSVPLADAKNLAEALGDRQMSYRELGIRSFEYMYDDYVGA